MSSTEQNISATSVTADSANIGAINSGSITNTNGIKTDSLGVEGSALIGGNLSVNGAAEIMGALNKSVTNCDKYEHTRLTKEEYERQIDLKKQVKEMLE